MCKAFSGIIKENGDVLWEFAVDSHEDIIKKHGLTDTGGPRSWARFEITPANGSYLTPDNWTFRLDEDNAIPWFTEWHRGECYKAHASWLKKLNKIMVNKTIVRPFRDIVQPKKITKKHIDLLRKWASVRASVWASVRSSVRSSAGASVRSSVWDSVWDSVWAYNSSFFDIDYGYDYSNLNKLWNLGLVPSFDGKTWRLHGGPEGEVLWKGEI
jgi:hypothetical protein